MMRRVQDPRYGMVVTSTLVDGTPSLDRIMLVAQIATSISGIWSGAPRWEGFQLRKETDLMVDMVFPNSHSWLEVE